ncbi:ABC transporter permease [Ruminococcus sp.]|uniref:ABC transporter permease n=1 Tax=Ruminococcus sp. TaxID=41978 RepID=UPI003869F386
MMTNLLKMEWYKLRTSRLFIVLLIVTFALNALLLAALPLASSALGQEMTATNLSAILASPFALGLLMIPIFISAVSFLYLDFSGGYIKNIAGQLPDRGSIVFAKFIMIGVHNLIFFIVAALSAVLASAATSGLVMDEAIGGGVLTLLLKWLLSLSICSILMFFAVGLRNKTLAIIMAVVFSTGALSLLYLGINSGISALFKVENVSVGDYLPDSLMGSVNAITGDLVVNAIIVAVVFIALFLSLTYIMFKKRDVK